ncbi:MAG: tripartite tricarboxylate transporter TctB family protein [Candidatus Methylomirabilales bacterium]
MRTLRSADLVTGGLVALLGAVALLASRSIKAMPGESLDPRTLPSLVGWVMVLAGAGIAHAGWRYRGEPVRIPWPSRVGVRRLLVTAGALPAYALLIEPLGFPLATAAFVAFHAWYLGRYPAWVTLLGGALAGTAVYYVFMQLLELTFPLGLLEYLQ